MNASYYLSLVTSIILVVMGLLLVTGIVYGQAEVSARVVFGILFILYGAFRIVSLSSKRRTALQEQRREEMQNAKERLFKK